MHTVEPVETAGEAPRAGWEVQHPRKAARAGSCAPNQHKISPITPQVTPHLSEGQQLPASDGFLPAHFTSNLGDLISSTCLWNAANLSTVQLTFLRASLFSSELTKELFAQLSSELHVNPPTGGKVLQCLVQPLHSHPIIKVAAATSVK